MPNLPLHIHLAQVAAQRLRHPALDQYMGHVFLGATSPDIRALTRRRREEYHFTSLDFDSIGAGVMGLFDSNPHLANSSDHTEQTQAFVAGYISHLIADETWIIEMYRPYFGNPRVFEDEVFGKVMDRALQLELDRQSMQATRSAIAQIAAASDGVRIGFIPHDTLDQWREWVVALLQRDFAWDRLAFMARRVAAGDTEHPAHRFADEFLQAMPESLERLHQVVPRERVDRFRERALHHLVSAIGDYLP